MIDFWQSTHPLVNPSKKPFQGWSLHFTSARNFRRCALTHYRLSTLIYICFANLTIGSGQCQNFGFSEILLRAYSSDWQRCLLTGPLSNITDRWSGVITSSWAVNQKSIIICRYLLSRGYCRGSDRCFTPAPLSTGRRLSSAPVHGRLVIDW